MRIMPTARRKRSNNRVMVAERSSVKLGLFDQCRGWVLGLLVSDIKQVAPNALMAKCKSNYAPR